MLRTGRLTPFLFLAPMLGLLAVVFGYPLVAIFDFSTRRIRGASGPFIGLENFHSILKDDIFRDAIRHNGQLLLLVRSEEHTSELQSRFDLVCRLLLEKKND